jgi:hypothetical protein
VSYRRGPVAATVSFHGQAGFNRAAVGHRFLEELRPGATGQSS